MAPGPKFLATLLRRSARAYAKAALHDLRASRTDGDDLGLPATFAAPIDDIEMRLLHLAASVAVDRPALLANALAWYKVALHHRDVPPDYLMATVAAIEATLARELPPDAFPAIKRHLAAACKELPNAPVDLPSHLSKDAPHGEQAMHFLLANLEGRGEDALDILRNGLRDGISIAELHDHVLTPAQREAGRMWLMGEIPIADEHYGSAIVDRALGLLHEHLPRPGADAPRVLALGVGGNLHELGLRVVGQRLQLAGFHVHHLGGNMPASDIEWALHDRPADLFAISATLLLHLQSLIEVVESLRAAMAQVYGNAAARPILVGGEPFRVVPDLHRVVGADAAATDAVGAVETARRLTANLR